MQWNLQNLVGKLNIVIFMGKVDVLDYFIERFIEYLKKNNINHYIVDINNSHTYQCYEFDCFISRENVCVLSFNDVGVNLCKKDGENLWASRKIPFFTYIVDHPRNYDDAMLYPMCNLYVFALDENHVDFIHKYYTDVKGAFFSPNGGTETGIKKNYTERIIDVLYMGNCQPPITSYPIIPLLNDNGISLYEESISMLLQTPMLSTEEAIINYLDRKQLKFDDMQVFSIVQTAAPYIEKTVRRYFKLSGIRALDSMGIKVDIYGNGWECDEPYSDNIKIHPRISIYDLMKLISDAKISLCYIPWFKKGCSEKNFDSMLNGALCVSDRSDYLNSHYTDGYNIIYFDLNNPEQMAYDIKWLLEHPSEAEAISRRGYETAKVHDTWYKRCEYVLQIMCEVVFDKGLLQNR